MNGTIAQYPIRKKIIALLIASTKPLTTALIHEQNKAIKLGTISNILSTVANTFTEEEGLVMNFDTQNGRVGRAARALLFTPELKALGLEVIDSRVKEYSNKTKRDRNAEKNISVNGDTVPYNEPLSGPEHNLYRLRDQTMPTIDEMGDIIKSFLDRTGLTEITFRR